MKLRLFIGLFVWTCFACAPSEKLDPLYQAQTLELSNSYATRITSHMPMSVITPSLLKRLVGGVFGWIPIVGDLLELPLDIGMALLPPLSTVHDPNLPPNADITDPAILAKLNLIQIEGGHLGIVPENERGRNYKPEQCWFGRCEEVGFSFLHELRIYIVFYQAKKEMPVLIASATQANYDQAKQQLTFIMSRANLKPYLQKYKRYRVKVVASGKLPEHTVYINGRFQIRLDFNFQKAAGG